MNKILIFLSLLIIQGCLISQKELDELNADNNYYSSAQTIKCMQMPSPQRPTPINKKGETRESYDQSDCYDDLLTKNTRELSSVFSKQIIIAIALVITFSCLSLFIYWRWSLRRWHLHTLDCLCRRVIVVVSV